MKQMWSRALFLGMGIAMLAGTAQVASADLNDGLVAYYPFNGNANDESSNGNNGTVNGATLTEDRFGNPNSAYHFDGLDDYIEVLESPTIDFQNGTNISIAGWIKTCSSGTIVAKHVYGYWNGYWLNVNWAGTLWTGTSSFYASSHEYAYSNNPVNDCQWHFLVGILNSGTGITNTYIDGVLQSDTGRQDGNLDSSANLFLGAWKQGNIGNYGAEELDDVRIYNRALSEAEILELYGGTSVTSTPSSTTPHHNDTVCVQVNVADVANLYAAGFDLAYDPSVLDYTGAATEGTFLNADGQVSTSLQVQPLNGDENSGKMVVGISRLGDVTGASGSGNLVTLCFNVVGAYCSSSSITFGNAILEGQAEGSSISTSWNGSTLTVTLSAPTNPHTTDAGTHNQINLCWNAATGASQYEVYRSNTAGVLGDKIATTTSVCYEDKGCILPTLNYYYQVRAITNNGQCVSAYSLEASGAAAGLLGDINNDGRVNGKDLSHLARVFGSACGSPKYDCRSDLNRDCHVDGADLLKLAADFGKTL